MSNALQVAHGYMEAWNRRDAQGIVATFAAGGTYSDPLAKGIGGETLIAYVRGLWQAFPDLCFEIGDQTLVGEQLVAFQWLMKGTNSGPFQGLPPSGREVILPGADFITVAGDKIQTVQGYFDAGEVPRQLGLQITAQPYTLGPFQFGLTSAVQSGSTNRPGAFSITVLHTRSEQEVEQVRDYSKRLVPEMLSMPGFIGWTGINVGDRMITVTAREDPESPRGLTRESSHTEAMK